MPWPNLGRIAEKILEWGRCNPPNYHTTPGPKSEVNDIGNDDDNDDDVKQINKTPFYLKQGQ